MQNSQIALGHSVDVDFRVSGENLDALVRAFDKANKSGSFNLQVTSKHVIRFIQFNTVRVPLADNQKAPEGIAVFEQVYHTVNITGTVNGIPGFEIIGKIDDAEGVRQIFNFSDADVSHHRTRALYCNHCNTNHKRVSTVLVRNTNTGEVFQVGNSCIEIFTGTREDITKELRRMFAIAETFTFDPENTESYGTGNRMYSVKEIVMLALAVNAANFNGQYMKSVDGMGTKILVLQALEPMQMVNICKMNRGEMEEKFSNKADALIAEYRDMTVTAEESDFLFNLTQIAGADYIPFKRIGIACALTFTKKPRTEKRTGKGYFGEVDASYKNIELDIVTVTAYNGNYGLGYAVTAFIGDNKITCFTTKEYQVGKKVISFKVKEHRNDPRFGEQTMVRITSRG